MPPAPISVWSASTQSFCLILCALILDSRTLFVALDCRSERAYRVLISTAYLALLGQHIKIPSAWSSGHRGSPMMAHSAEDPMACLEDSCRETRRCNPAELGWSSPGSCRQFLQRPWRAIPRRTASHVQPLGNWLRGEHHGDRSTTCTRCRPICRVPWPESGRECLLLGPN